MKLFVIIDPVMTGCISRDWVTLAEHKDIH